MKIRETAIAGVVLIESSIFSDHRGSFSRLYCERELESVVGNRRIVQINHSRTAEVGAVRGLHFQRPPHGEMKLVRCLAGRVWDVAVDLRAASPTYLRWHAEELVVGSGRMMIIPEGCAHGFQVLEPDSQLLYLHTAFYVPEAEGGVLYSDPRLNIAWPLPVTEVSQRDRSHGLVDRDFKSIEL